MKSMTGFGYRENASPDMQASVEVKAYNNRYLDIYAYLPPHLSPLEPRLRGYVGERVLRGRVEVSVKVKDLNACAAVDRATVVSMIEAVREVARIAGLGEEVRLSHLLRLEGLVRIERDTDLESCWLTILPALEGAMADFEAQRLREGLATRGNIVDLLERIGTAVDAIARLAPELEEHFKTTIRNRLAETLNGQVDENRLLSEVAMLLVRFSINEELVRLRSHIEGFRAILNETGAIGKKLDFLCQEIHREINTAASKSVIVDVSRQAVILKDAIENIREQLRNVE